MTWGILWIFTQPLKSSKILFQCAILSKVYEVWAKTYGGVIFHDTEQWCKIWINPDLVVWKMAWGIGWTFITALKNLKNCILMGSFCPKDMFQLENFRGIMCHDTEEKWKMTSGIWLIFLRAGKSLKICTLIGSFWPKHIKI